MVITKQTRRTKSSQNTIGYTFNLLKRIKKDHPIFLWQVKTVSSPAAPL